MRHNSSLIVDNTVQDGGSSSGSFGAISAVPAAACTSMPSFQRQQQKKAGDVLKNKEVEAQTTDSSKLEPVTAYLFI